MIGWHAWQTPEATHQKGYFHVLLATLHGRMGQLPKAIAAAEEGLALLPPTPTAARVSGLTMLGVACSIKGKILDCYPHFEAADHKLATLTSPSGIIGLTTDGSFVILTSHK